jgi:hypothetical protein
VIGWAVVAAFRLFRAMRAAYFAGMEQRWMQIARYFVSAALAVVAALRMAAFLHQTCGMRRIELRTDALVLAALLAFVLAAKFLTQRRSKGRK